MAAIKKALHLHFLRDEELVIVPRGTTLIHISCRKEICPLFRYGSNFMILYPPAVTVRSRQRLLPLLQGFNALLQGQFKTNSPLPSTNRQLSEGFNVPTIPLPRISTDCLLV